MDYSFFQNPLNIGLIIYSLTVFTILFLVYKKSRLFYNLSNHEGIFFFGVGFLMMAIGNLLFLPIKYPPFEFGTWMYYIVPFIFYFFFNSSTLFLVFSQFQKKFDYNLKEAFTILLCGALALSIIDILFFKVFSLFFSFNILMFFILCIKTFFRFLKDKNKKSKIIKLMFFIVMLLTFVTWVMNFIVKYVFKNSPFFMVLLIICSIFTHSTLFYAVNKAVGKVS